jgi:hypothetical protein
MKASRLVTVPLLVTLLLLLPAAAADAQVTIDQEKAMRGRVTPGDAPGLPVTISRPGSYKLTGNLVYGVDEHGPGLIEVTASDVIIDLNGFVLFGIYSGGFLSGAVRSVGQRTVMMNGTLSGVGIHFLGAGNRVERVIVDGGAGGSLVDVGPNSRVTNSIIHGADGWGLTVGPGSVVVGNIIADHDFVGLEAGAGTVILQNSFPDNSFRDVSPADSTVAAGHNVIQWNEGGQFIGGALKLAPNLCGGIPCP